MKARAYIYPVVAFVFLTGMFAVNVYRAATQSITTDEGYSYYLYVGAKPFNLFRQFDANLHFLYTLLDWFTVRTLGLSHLTLRLPSLLACGLYFAAIWRLCRRQFGASIALVAGVVVLTVNPLVEDHMSAARGYGLALALLAWAFVEALEAAQASEFPKKHLFRIAILTALSVASNLTYLIPSAALIVVLMGIVWRNTKPPVAAFVYNLIGPVSVLTFLLLVIPLSRIEPGRFYFGEATLAASVHGLVEMSLGGQTVAIERTSMLGGLLLAAGMAVSVVLLVRWYRRGTVDSQSLFVLLGSGTMVLTVGILAAAHSALGMAYPLARTGIYLLFLVPLALLPIARWRIGAIALLLLSGPMIHAIRVDRYQEWFFDADNRDVMQQMMTLERNTWGTPRRIYTSSFLDQSVRLYRDMYGLTWIAAVDSFAWKSGYDYYIVSFGDRDRLEKLGLRTIFTGSRTHVVLAVPGSDVPSKETH